MLVRIDDRQYQQRVAQRRAERDAARFELENLDQQLAADRATLAARRADLFAAEAEEARARADERRVDELAQRGSASIRERDQTRASARAASANVRKARAAIEIAEQTLKASGISGRPAGRSRSPRQRCTGRDRRPTPRSSPLAMGGSARWACAWASTLLPARSCCSGAAEALGDRQLQRRPRRRTCAPASR